MSLLRERIKLLDTIRARLTLWHVCVLAVLQAAFCCAVYFWFDYDIHRSTDGILQNVMSDTINNLKNKLNADADELSAPVYALRSLRHTGSAFAIYDLKGQLLAERPLVQGAELSPFPTGLAPIPEEHPRFSTWERGTVNTRGPDAPSHRRVAVQKVVFPKYDVTYVIVTSIDLDSLLLKEGVLKKVFLVSVPLVLLLAGSAGWFLARKSLSPVVSMSERARQIGADNIEERLMVANPRDELGNLALTFNELLDRLSQALFKQRRFMADAAHELRTPISVIRTAAAVALDQEHRDEKEYREVLAITNAQARHLTRTVEDVFHLARADDGHSHLQTAPLYLDEVLAQAVRDAAILGKTKNITVESKELPESPFTGDEALLSRMALNLLENSIKYTLAGGKVTLSLELNDGYYVISVTDTGIGIPPEAQKHIFDRFYRGAPAHIPNARHPEGSGLGLSIAKWIAECHKGSLELRSTGESGTCFIASLPVES